MATLDENAFDALAAKAAVWLRSVLCGLPAVIRAVYVEYGDAYTPSMEHLVCFNAFGFESLAGGRFNPANPDHVAELGEFTWQPTDECHYRAYDYPGIDWLAVLHSAARSGKIVVLAAECGIQLIVGERDGDVLIIR